MLVATRGLNPTMLNKRHRTLPTMAAAMNTVDAPKLYIFNIYNRQHVKENGTQGRFVIPACEAGKEHSKPLVIDGLVLSEYDLGDGAGTMGTAVDTGISVAEDIIGSKSTSAALDLFTTNLEWFGVFISKTPKPTRTEIDAAREKLTEMMKLVYAKGAELVQAGDKVSMLDRRNYNDAADFLGLKSLWGNQEAVLDRCVFCKEPIQMGAIKCKHCGEKLNTDEAKALAKAN